MTPEWYKLPAAQVLAQLGSDQDQGLAGNEAARLLEQAGPNELQEKAQRSRTIGSMVIGTSSAVATMLAVCNAFM